MHTSCDEFWFHFLQTNNVVFHSLIKFLIHNLFSPSFSSYVPKNDIQILGVESNALSLFTACFWTYIFILLSMTYFSVLYDPWRSVLDSSSKNFFCVPLLQYASMATIKLGLFSIPHKACAYVLAKSFEWASSWSNFEGIYCEKLEFSLYWDLPFLSASPLMQFIFKASCY